MSPRVQPSQIRERTLALRTRIFPWNNSRQYLTLLPEVSQYSPATVLHIAYLTPRLSLWIPDHHIFETCCLNINSTLGPSHLILLWGIWVNKIRELLDVNSISSLFLGSVPFFICCSRLVVILLIFQGEDKDIGG